MPSLQLVYPMDRLTSTPFFIIAQQEETHCPNSLQSEYPRFAEQVYSLCQTVLDPAQLFFILSYTSIELKALGPRCATLNKAIELLDAALNGQRQYPQLHRPVRPIAANSSLVWTGKSVHLVELAYALCELRSVNHGAVGISDLIDYLAHMFGLEIKDCFGAYGDIKRRKGDSRTYFLDQLAERLNERIARDEQK